MTKRETVLLALYAALSAGGVQVARNAALPESVPATGLIHLHDGNPGQPDETMSPHLFHYEHRAELDIFIEAATNRDARFDALVAAIGAILAADRTLGGVCDWVMPEAPQANELYIAGAAGIKAATIPVVLHYTSTDPLG